MRHIEDTGLFLLDMDGTFYLGDELLPGAVEFLAACKERGIPYTFLTNNSSKSAEAYLAKLHALGVDATPEQMLTSGDATLVWMERAGMARDILLIGTPSLERQFEQAGYEVAAPNPAAVVLGFDTTLDYAKLCALCAAVKTGVPYIATHPDFNCPVPGGEIPDIGATIAYVQASVHRSPDVVIGKPNRIIAEMAAARFGVNLHELCMVGDRLYTDIALGRHGLATALVLCGETDAGALAGSDVQPDWVFADLAEMAAVLRGAPPG